jgi:hypothetical protein
MNNDDLLIALLLIAVVFGGVHYYQSGSGTGMTYMRSNVDRREYLVRDVPNKQRAADILAQLCQSIKKLKAHLGRRIDAGEIEMSDDLSRFINHFDEHSKVSERTPTDEFTSYTLNKDTMHFCLITRDSGDRLHDLNTLVFVLIHELSHLSCAACKDHDEKFNKRFRFLLEEAVAAGVYTPQDFRRNPQRYCGITVSDTPLDDSYFSS